MNKIKMGKREKESERVKEGDVENILIENDSMFD
jgi:hypothetical protein